MINSSGPPIQQLPYPLSVGPIVIEVTLVAVGEVQALVEANVVAREDDWSITSIKASFARQAFESDEDLLRRALHSLVCHEVDEKIKKNGIRLFDPHMYGG